MTRSEILDTVYLRVIPKPSDDDILEKSWMQQELDVSRQEALSKYYSAFKSVPPEALTRFDCQTVTTETPVCLTGSCYARYYVAAPTYTEDGNTTSSAILTLPRDYGVFRVATAGGEVLNRITLGQADYISKIKYAKPDAENDGWSRQGNKIYLLGRNFGSVKILIDIVLANTESISDDAQYPIPGGELTSMVMADLQRKCLEFLGRPSDYRDDGKPVNENPSSISKNPFASMGRR